MDKSGSEGRRLIVAIDNRFTNRTVLRDIPERTTLVGRVRKDAVFFYPPKEGPGRGR